MASYNPINPPTQLTMLDMKATLDNFNGPAKQCRFAVKITPSGSNNIMNSLGYGPLFRDMMLLCEATELPGRGFDPTEVRYYGPSMQFPRNSKYNNDMPMTFICRNGSYERQMFDDWMECINPTNTFDFNYTDNYMCQLDVFTFSDGGLNAGATAPVATYSWSLLKAWPSLVNPQPVTWADQDILKLSVSFYYRYWRRPGRDSATVSARLASGQ